MKGPTQRQLAVLAFIRAHMTAEQMPPTTRDICNHFGFASTNAAHDHLQALASHGLIERTAHKTRPWRPTATPTPIVVLAPSADDRGVTCAPTMLSSEAIAIGETLRALARSQPLPEEALAMMERVGSQLASAGRFALDMAK